MGSLLRHPFWTAIGAIATVVALVVANITPIYAVVEDGDRCGWQDVRRTVPPEFEFTECRDPAHGVERFQYSETVGLESGWVRGGYSQPWWCEQVRQRKQQAVGQSITWEAPTSSERSRRDVFGHVEYKYTCKITASWSPIYNIKRTPSCPKVQAIETVIHVARKCQDGGSTIGWKVFGFSWIFTRD